MCFPIVNPDKPENVWSDEVSRIAGPSQNTISVVYSFRLEGGGYTIAIKPDAGGLRISTTSIAD
ncbi:hypothetical protein [Abyssalbus ytuae]|uniref:Uncharacterized protein n=1 Tax=Abyssalbus ytuae TaxID=2926907 RepID=A0A9E7D4E2_9FLAO|nr:hypothetical protein [Abyssalbus ytuae]UOB18819.1 hypothetical protein MQE35_05870 [Abyssalbus ytuae]